MNRTRRLCCLAIAGISTLWTAMPSNAAGFNDNLYALFELDGNWLSWTNGFGGIGFGTSFTADRFISTQKSASFDGSTSYIDFSLYLSARTNYTVSFWFIDTNNGVYSGEGAKMLDQSTDSSHLWYISMQSGGTITFRNREGVFDSVLTATASPSYRDNKWHHVAVVRGYSNPAYGFLFVDGVQKDFKGTLRNVSSSRPLFMGSSAYGVPPGGNFFGGRIDGLTIHTRPLDPVQVTQMYLDTDQDGISNIVEKSFYSDTDITPDYRDSDSDDDGIPDQLEALPTPANPRNTDRDSLPDYRDPDSDNDGIPDAVERGPDGNSPRDTDGDATPDYRDTDSDNDGVADALERGPTPSNPPDTDKDGLPDYRDRDSDNDGFPDGTEDANRNGKLDALETSPLEPLPLAYPMGLRVFPRRNPSFLMDPYRIYHADPVVFDWSAYTSNNPSISGIRWNLDTVPLSPVTDTDTPETWPKRDLILSPSSNTTWYFHIAPVQNDGQLETNWTTHIRLKFDARPPPASSTTHPVQTSWYTNRTVSIQWQPGHGDTGSITRSHYQWNQSPTARLTTNDTSTITRSFQIEQQQAGTYYLHLATRDYAGMLSTSTHFRVNLGIDPSLVPPLADFSAHSRTGQVPMIVHFANQSTGTITSAAWDFDGNGITDSTDPGSPSHTYRVPGIYTVRLGVAGPLGSNSLSRPLYIDARKPTSALLILE